MCTFYQANECMLEVDNENARKGKTYVKHRRSSVFIVNYEYI